MEVPERSRTGAHPFRLHRGLMLFLVIPKIIGMAAGIVALLLFFGIVIGVPN